MVTCFKKKAKEKTNFVCKILSHTHERRLAVLEVSQQVTSQMGFGSVEKPLASTWKVKGCRLRNPALRHEPHKSMDFLGQAFLTKPDIKQVQARTSERSISGIYTISLRSKQPIHEVLNIMLICLGFIKQLRIIVTWNMENLWHVLYNPHH